METAITIWVDESTDIRVNGKDYNLIGYLITDSDSGELSFLNELKQSRKIPPVCWNTIHGCEVRESDKRKLDLINRWLEIFKKTEGVYFHSFLYKKNTRYVSNNQTYENYFAKQSVFSLAHKMKKSGYVLNTMFNKVKTLFVFFDGRRSHSTNLVSRGDNVEISRLNELEGLYKEEIGEQIRRITGRDFRTNNFTIRFSFLSSECFDGMQFSDCVLYLLRHKIEQTESGYENVFTKLFDKHFLDDLDPHTKALGFKKIYEFDKKFNFFESNAV